VREEGGKKRKKKEEKPEKDHNLIEAAVPSKLR